jgi:hypothetical protein
LISFVACRIATRAETDVRGEPWVEAVLFQGKSRETLPKRNRSTDPARLKQILDRILSHSGEFYRRADFGPGSQAHLTISPYRLGTVPGGRLFGPGYLAQDPRSAHKTASSE